MDSCGPQGGAVARYPLPRLRAEQDSAYCAYERERIQVRGPQQRLPRSQVGESAMLLERVLYGDPLINLSLKLALNVISQVT